MATETKKRVGIAPALAFIALLIVIAIVAVVWNSNDRAAAEYANGSAMVLGVGQEYEMPVDNRGVVRFKSYDKDVVTVSGSGVFKAVSKGTARVKVGSGEITVQVEDAPTAISFSESEIAIGSGEKYKPAVKVEGSELNTGFKFASTDTNIITIDAAGNITGVAEGSADISVESYNGLSSKARVNVLKAPESVTFPKTHLSVFTGSEEELRPSIPSGSACAEFTLESSDTNIAKTDGMRLIPVSAGTCEITATSYNGKSAVCTVTVTDAPFYIRTNLDPNKKMIALSFDDGPNYKTTSMVLDTLEKYDASATFFMVANRVNGKSAECANRMVEMGCELGNHTYDHKHYGNDVTAADIQNGINHIKEKTGHAPTVFRPTGGYLSDTIKQNAGAPICLWSIDTNDWKYKNADRIASTVLKYADDGDIVLMHDIYKTSAEAVQKFVPELVNRGFQIVNIAELAYYKGVDLKNGEVYSSIK